MKNVFKVLGIIALVAVIGFSMVSCGGDDDGGGNTGGQPGGGGNTGGQPGGGGLRWRAEFVYIKLDPSSTYSMGSWSSGKVMVIWDLGVNLIPNIGIVLTLLE